MAVKMRLTRMGDKKAPFYLQYVFANKQRTNCFRRLNSAANPFLCLFHIQVKFFVQGIVCSHQINVLSVADVNRLIKQFEQTRDMMKKMSKSKRLPF